MHRILQLLSAFAVALASCLTSSAVLAQLDFEAEPINYHEAPTRNLIESLKRKIERGDATLSFNQEQGYLRSLLNALDIPLSSQMLVFSKTSFQLRRISPQRPRAVYFNDDVYVGWVQGGDVIEISTASPDLGAVFYTLNQDRVEVPEITRDRGQCIACHASSRTLGVPGHLVRSVYTSRSGQPRFGSGTFTTDHSSPFKERWGGWYVTGTHGSLRHMGNAIASGSGSSVRIDMESGANASDLSDHIDTEPYLSPHSDIVALMVLEHQTQMHNYITRANFETREALHYDNVMNEALGRSEHYRSESTQRRIAAATEKLVDYLLFVEELKLTDAVKGTSAFAEEFASRGPFDHEGRTLRDFDLQHRMMKYPCSYLIYSNAFNGLPDEAKVLVYRRLSDILTGKESDRRYAHLSKADRKAILEILRDTKTDLPRYWNEGAS